MATMASDNCVVSTEPKRAEPMPEMPYINPEVGFDASAGTMNRLIFFSFFFGGTVSVVCAFAAADNIINAEIKRLLL